MKPNQLTTKLLCLFSLLLVTALSGLAQEAPKPQLSCVSVTQVKPEMWAQFLEFYKNETLPALKKGGIKQSLVMHTNLSAYTQMAELSITPAPANTASN